MSTRAVVQVPFGTAAVVKRKGSRQEADALLVRKVALEVESIDASRLAVAAVTEGWTLPGVQIQETVWSMDGRLFRPLGLDYRTGEIRHVASDGAFDRWAAGGDYDLFLQDDLPEAAMSRHHLLPTGRWQRPEILAHDERGLRLISEPDEAEAATRLARLQRRLIVVDGAVWTECPAPRFIADSRYYGVGLLASAGVRRFFYDGHELRSRAFQFPLTRPGDALACAVIAGADEPGEQAPALPRFEVRDPEAVHFDALAASAFHMGPHLLADLKDYAAGFSDEGLESFMQIRAAVRRMHENEDDPLPPAYGQRDDAAILHEACGRLADDPGCRPFAGMLLAGPMPFWLPLNLRQFAERHRQLEAEDAPEFGLGGPAA